MGRGDWRPCLLTRSEPPIRPPAGHCDDNAEGTGAAEAACGITPGARAGARARGEVSSGWRRTKSPTVAEGWSSSATAIGEALRRRNGRRDRVRVGGASWRGRLGRQQRRGSVTVVWRAGEASNQRWGAWSESRAPSFLVRSGKRQGKTKAPGPARVQFSPSAPQAACRRHVIAVRHLIIAQLHARRRYPVHSCVGGVYDGLNHDIASSVQHLDPSWTIRDCWHAGTFVRHDAFRDAIADWHTLYENRDRQLRQKTRKLMQKIW